ncbi:hypothetical protein SELMODRAFT_235386 [Selaginella moellendorffii]|uniref:Uncharacterized protein n=1 Tax=Selaginella moellendorffii TaxID=88036 RepID=D8SWV4_SELML|nr:hypothetical protein SELMODRAFT_235386 [Selaginella moellendorffii]
MAERLEHGLALLPRVRLFLVFRRLGRSAVKHIDEWLLKEWVRSVVRKSLKVELGEKDLVKCRVEEEAVTWELFVWDSQVELARKSCIGALDGVEFIIGGAKLRCGVQFDEKDSFAALRSSWETVFGSDVSDHSSKFPDTLVLKGLPSRWFAEPRVSTQASVLVTHTVFSKFGKLRNLEIVNESDTGKTSSLQCNVWIQYERYSGFYNAVEALCGRSMQKFQSQLSVGVGQ